MKNNRYVLVLYLAPLAISVKTFLLFLFGAFIYMGIEVAFDSTSDRSMGLIGGISFILCGELFIMTGLEQDLTSFYYWLACLVIAVIIMALEYLAGLIWNKDYHIWDYRKLPFNYKGHISLTFFMIWFLLISHH